jgi:hypothetical protein
MGRITGSSSIETLVRVGLEKEAGKYILYTVIYMKYINMGRNECK